ncbi:helix-turn-helix domain-containing protein [Pedobacter frigoris]|nr:AraC family transcriptional regulator [Pedobacter frigoris]
MTPKGEELTLKGEISSHIFSVNREVTLYHSSNADSFSALVDKITNQQGDNLQMIFVAKGRLGCTLLNAKKPFFTFEDQQHNLLAANKKLMWDIEEEEHDILCLNISFSFLSRYLPDDHSGYLDLKKGIELSKPAAFSKNNLYITPEINAILNTLKSSPHTGFCAKLFLESKVLELLMLQSSQFEQSRASETTYQLKKEELNRMQEVKEILTENIDTPFSLRTLAHMVGTNEFNLKRNFKIAFGTTVYGYLNQYKMEQAKAMLIEKDITIAELSGKMGYKYATHFTSAFKKYFGYLPNKLKSGKLSLLIFAEELAATLEHFLIAMV